MERIRFMLDFLFRVVGMSLADCGQECEADDHSQESCDCDTETDGECLELRLGHVRRGEAQQTKHHSPQQQEDDDGHRRGKSTDHDDSFFRFGWERASAQVG